MTGARNRAGGALAPWPHWHSVSRSREHILVTTGSIGDHGPLDRARHRRVRRPWRGPSTALDRPGAVVEGIIVGSLAMRAPRYGAPLPVRSARPRRRLAASPRRRDPRRDPTARARRAPVRIRRSPPVQAIAPSVSGTISITEIAHLVAEKRVSPPERSSPGCVTAARPPASPISRDALRAPRASRRCELSRAPWWRHRRFVA